MAQDPGRAPMSGQTDLLVNMSASGSGSTGAEQPEAIDASVSVSMPGPSAAINGGVTRKQNVACDACRAKKIKCLRTSLVEKCEQCTAKGSECTSLYIEQLQSKQKKGRKRSDGEHGAKRRRSDDDMVAAVAGQGSEGNDSPGIRRPSLVSTYHVGESSRRPSASSHHSRIPSERQQDLLRYLFAPEPVHHDDWGYTDSSSVDMCKRGEADLWEENGGQTWEEEPSEAHMSLKDEQLKELADDLIETFFSIVHIRHPCLDPISFRERLHAPDTHPLGHLSHAFLAVTICLGARFSDNMVIAADREEMTERDNDPQGRSRSRIVQMLVIRSREVVEVCKILRKRSLENAQVLTLMESNLAQASFLGDKYQPYHIFAAVRHLCAMGYNTPSGVMTIQSETERMAAISLWWIVCLSDGFRSAFYGLKPCLSDDDYDIGPPIPQPNGGDPDDAPQSAVLFTAANAGAYIARKLCTEIYIPRIRTQGIPLATLREFVHSSSVWRDKYLFKLGVPAKWPQSWDFLGAITACSTDVYFHAMWLCVMRSIKDFGVAEIKAAEKGEPNMAAVEVEAIVKRIRGESEHGSLRIAALAAVLLENGYLRLDPLVLNHPIWLAGCYLAESGRDECRICIAALRQYSVSFGHLWDLADEIESIYLSAISSRVSLSAQGSSPGTSISPWLGPGPGGPGSRPSSTLSTPMFGQPGLSPGLGGGMDFSATATIATSTGLSSTLAMAADAIHSPESAWNVQGAAAVLASNGYTALPMHTVMGDGEGEQGRDVSSALYEWLGQM